MSGFVAILICLVLSAFFSGMEIAFMASNKLRIEIDKSNKGITQKLIGIFVLYPVFPDLVFLRVVRGIVAEDIYRTQTDA